MKVKKIFTKNVAFELISKGCNLLDMEPNYKIPKFKVYVFEDTPEFRKYLNQITLHKSKEKSNYEETKAR